LLGLGQLRRLLDEALDLLAGVAAGRDRLADLRHERRQLGGKSLARRDALVRLAGAFALGLRFVTFGLVTLLEQRFDLVEVIRCLDVALRLAMALDTGDERLDLGARWTLQRRGNLPLHFGETLRK